MEKERETRRAGYNIHASTDGRHGVITRGEYVNGKGR